VYYATQLDGTHDRKTQVEWIWQICAHWHALQGDGPAEALSLILKHRYHPASTESSLGPASAGTIE
jgi:hypothetical protein